MVNWDSIKFCGLTSVYGALVLTILGASAAMLDRVTHSKTMCPLERAITQDIDNDGEEEEVSVGVCNFHYWFFPDETQYRIHVTDGDSKIWYGSFNQKLSNLRLEDINNDGDLDIRVNAGGSEYVLEQIPSPATDTYIFTEPAEY